MSQGDTSLKSILLLDHAEEKPSSNFRLIRLCEWAGHSFKDFSYATTSGHAEDWATARQAARIVVPMGPRAAQSAGINGQLDKVRGYVWPSDGRHTIPTVSPGYIQRGNAKWSAPFINDLQKAVRLARGEFPTQFTDYCLDPSPLGALEWAKRYASALGESPDTRLAFDIETPGKAEAEDESDTDSDAPDRTWNIERIGFSYRGLSALSIPWAPEYQAAIKLLMGSTGEKVVWNQGFDVPRIRRAGVPINGLIHDGMVAWHILHSDLPKRLGFVATFTCPWQPAWKHLSSAKPAFYNATDADVELRSMEAIEASLREADLWKVYQRDVLDLEPILVHMQQAGMPVDAEIRLDRAIKLTEKLAVVKAEMESCVPLEARRIDIVYKATPKDVTGLSERAGTRLVPTCAQCGAEKPRKDHFKRFVKKLNPCADSGVKIVERAVTEYYRLSEFSPSRDQLIRYHNLLKRPCPMVYDKKTRQRKVSFGEEQLKTLILRYKDDRLYPLILEYRGLDKLAGTYVGRPVEVDCLK